MAGRHRWGKALAAVAALTMAVMTGVAAGPVAAVASDGTMGVSDSPLNCQAPEDQQGQGIPICDDKGTFLFTHDDQDNDPLLYTYTAPTNERVNIYYHFVDTEPYNGAINMGEELYVYLRVRNVSDDVLNTRVVLNASIKGDAQRFAEVSHQFENFPVYQETGSVTTLHTGEMYMGMQINGLEPADVQDCQFDIKFQYESKNGDDIDIMGTQTQALLVDNNSEPLYTIIFHTNSDAPESITPPSQTKLKTGETGCDPAAKNQNPIQYGYTFDGWFKDNKTFQKRHSFTDAVSDVLPKGEFVLHLYADWINGEFVGNSLHRWRYASVSATDAKNYEIHEGAPYYGKTDLRYEFEFKVPGGITSSTNLMLDYGGKSISGSDLKVKSLGGNLYQVNLVIKGYPNAMKDSQHHWFDAKLGAMLTVSYIDPQSSDRVSYSVHSDSNAATPTVYEPSSVNTTIGHIDSQGTEDEKVYVGFLRGWPDNPQKQINPGSVPNPEWNDEMNLENTVG